MMTMLPISVQSGTARILSILFSSRQPAMVSKEGIMRTVSKVKSIADDTIELEENYYYMLLALLHSSDDTTVISEEGEPLPGDECEKGDN